jgi:hypothetical protein
MHACVLGLHVGMWADVGMNASRPSTCSSWIAIAGPKAAPSVCLTLFIVAHEPTVVSVSLVSPASHNSCYFFVIANTLRVGIAAQLSTGFKVTQDLAATGNNDRKRGAQQLHHQEHATAIQPITTETWGKQLHE